MMWKENYKLGNALIDNHHKELFDKTEKLLGVVESEDFLTKKQECIDTIVFLKDYAVKHFVAEEEFQASLGYIDIDSHKLIHSEFISTVANAEQKLIQSNFNLIYIKEFCGFLTAWLVYHIAGADQKITRNKEISESERAIVQSPKECFILGIEDVFTTMLGENESITETDDTMESDDVVRIDIEHAGIWKDIKRSFSFIFLRETALNVVNALTDLGLTDIDELAYSALREMARIIINNVGLLMPIIKKAHSAQVIDNIKEFAFNTKHGKIIILINTDL